MFVPDVAGWRRERMPSMPAAAFLTEPPDWIVSPSTGAIDRGGKMRIYAREGVAHLWLVELLARTLEVYRLGGERRWIVVETFGADDVARAEPFAALALALDRWWLPGAESTR